MSDWTVDRIVRQSERGGVNRQEVMLLVGRIRQLEDEAKRLRDGIYKHAAWGTRALPVGAKPAPHDSRLWDLLEGDDDG